MTESNPAASELWARIEELFAQVLDMDAPARLAFLENLSASEPGLHSELVRLLTAHDSVGDFLDTLDARRGAALLESATSEEAAPPEVIGSYRLVRRLGGGGMGVVYLAWDASLGRPVALKLLHPRRVLSAQVRQLLVGEAKAAGSLDHPNIAPVYEVGETEDGRLFIAMAFCEGESLTERLARGPVPAQEAARIARQIADALSAAHRRGIVHRDIKPGNVMISPDGWVRLVDFGIALVSGRDAGSAVSAGTLGYMSPEQAAGGALDRRTDVWSLGVLLFEALTGRPPLRAGPTPDEGANRAELAESIQHLRTHVPESLVGIVQRCLAVDPADRPPGATALIHELDAFLTASATGALPAQVEPKEVGKGATRLRDRRRIVIPITGAGLLLAVVLVVWLNRAQAKSGANSSSAVLAILPFAPVAVDSALEQLGRELTVTLSSSLDGAGGIRVVEPVTVLGQVGPRGIITLEEAARLARGLGATQMLGGRVTLSGGDVRVDAVVHAVANLAVLGRFSSHAEAGDLSTLSDGLAAELLRGELNGFATGSTPNPGALTSRSLPALRAFLDGELHMAAGHFRAAPQAFERAIRADSTFWFAYWRYMYALSYHGVPVDTAIVRAVMAHRSEFPEPDRLLIESRAESSMQRRLEQLRDVANRFPAYWQAWFELGDALTHHGAFLGEPLEESLTALQRTTELNPRFLPAWEHYLWRAIQARDTARSRVILVKLQEFPIDSANTDRPDLEMLTYYRYLDHLARSGDQPLAAESEIGVRVLSGYSGSLPPERMAANFTAYGFYRAQLDVSQRIVQARPRPSILAAHTWGSALAHAGLGAWDSAFQASRRYARLTTHPAGPVWAYGLAVLGAWLGELHADSARLLRDSALRAEYGRSDEGRAETAWLDGLLACAQSDAAALRAERVWLQSNATPASPYLARSLLAFENALNGQRAEAAHSLSALEFQMADSAREFEFGARHPFLSGVNRLAAGSWLSEAGDSVQALKLLLLHETDLPSATHPLQAVNLVLATVAFPGLARIEEAHGQPERAQRYRVRVAAAGKPSMLGESASACVISRR
jgi:hypothetical protein